MLESANHLYKTQSFKTAQELLEHLEDVENLGTVSMSDDRNEIFIDGVSVWKRLDKGKQVHTNQYLERILKVANDNQKQVKVILDSNYTPVARVLAA